MMSLKVKVSYGSNVLFVVLLGSLTRYASKQEHKQEAVKQVTEFPDISERSWFHMQLKASGQSRKWCQGSASKLLLSSLWNSVKNISISCLLSQFLLSCLSSSRHQLQIYWMFIWPTGVVRPFRFGREVLQDHAAMYIQQLSGSTPADFLKPDHHLTWATF